jgi:hypothetical protein
LGAGDGVVAGCPRDGTTDLLRGAIFGFLARTGFTGPEEVVTMVLFDSTSVLFWIVVAAFKGGKIAWIGGGTIDVGLAD